MLIDKNYWYRPANRLSMVRVMIAGHFLFLLGISPLDAFPGTPVVNKRYDPLTVIGDSSNKGVFDPSIAYNQDGSVGYMVYSGLEHDPAKVEFYNVRYIHTHLAKTTDHGKTWTFVKRLNKSVADWVQVPVGPFKIAIRGAWHHEVPTLVFDAEDPTRPWKLFWHRYFSKDEKGSKDRPRILTHSWVMFKEAAAAEDLANADPVYLFGTSTAIIKPEFNFQAFTRIPKGGSTYTEPGSVYWNKKIYVVLSYFLGEDAHELILVSSADHGKTWDFLGVLLDEKDAFGPFRNFWGAELAVDQGRVFLMVPPIHKQYGYLGCYVFELEDLDRAKLKRTSDGTLIPHKYFPRTLPKELNSGQGDYDAWNTEGGFVMGQTDLEKHPQAPSLWNTHETLAN